MEQDELTRRCICATRSGTTTEQSRLGCYGVRMARAAGRDVAEVSPGQRVDDPIARPAAGRHCTRAVCWACRYRVHGSHLVGETDRVIVTDFAREMVAAARRAKQNHPLARARRAGVPQATASVEERCYV